MLLPLHRQWMQRKTNRKKGNKHHEMKSFETWWWQRRALWQRRCCPQSSSEASSAEVANAKSIRLSEYRKRLLNVVSLECASAVLEAARKKRQSLGLKTVQVEALLQQTTTKNTH